MAEVRGCRDVARLRAAAACLCHLVAGGADAQRGALHALLRLLASRLPRVRLDHSGLGFLGCAARRAARAAAPARQPPAASGPYTETGVFSYWACAQPGQSDAQCTQ